jgi:hypothetical protein
MYRKAPFRCSAVLLVALLFASSTTVTAFRSRSHCASAPVTNAAKGGETKRTPHVVPNHDLTQQQNTILSSVGLNVRGGGEGVAGIVMSLVRAAVKNPLLILCTFPCASVCAHSIARLHASF